MAKLIDRIFNKKKVKEQLKLSDERTGEDFKIVMSKPEIYYILG